jgi:hypothetical protein
MPKGFKGFQKGRKRTGGKEKGELKKADLTNGFKDRLRRYGFNFDKELNQYSELRALLPYTYPKLKEIEPPTVDVHDEPESAISTKDLLEAMNKNGQPDQTARPSSPGPSELPPVETGSISPPDAACSTRDLSDLAQIEGENA